jgi:lysophospholipase L1-like esterase
MHDIVIPYRPNKIVFYCGENDIAFGQLAPVVFDRFRIWFYLIRKYLPNVEIIYISMKPCPSRAQFQEQFSECNRLIKAFLQTQKKTTYIDIASLMLDSKGKARKELFEDDMLHMNKSGYNIWIQAIQAYL